LGRASRPESKTCSGTAAYGEELPTEDPEPRAVDRGRGVRGLAYGVWQGWLGIGFTNPALPAWAYPLALPLGAAVLGVGNWITGFWVRLLKARLPQEYERNLQQHAGGSRIAMSRPWMRGLWALRNGFAEEFLMRAFLLGTLMTQAGWPAWASVVLMSVLSALHHGRQGRLIGTIGVLPMQWMWTGIYFGIGDLVFLSLAHAAADGYGIWLRSRARPVLSQKSG
jgi:hypothetical protein